MKKIILLLFIIMQYLCCFADEKKHTFEDIKDFERIKWFGYDVIGKGKFTTSMICLDDVENDELFKVRFQRKEDGRYEYAVFGCNIILGYNGVIQHCSFYPLEQPFGIGEGIPVNGFAEQYAYKKIESFGNTIEGVYESNDGYDNPVDKFEIRKIKERDYVLLFSSFSGTHLLYSNGENSFYSDNTFGETDKPVYIYDDNFKIHLINYGIYNKRMLLVSNDYAVPLIPRELTMNNGSKVKVHKYAKLYDAPSFESECTENSETQEVEILQRVNNWIESGNDHATETLVDYSIDDYVYSVNCIIDYYKIRTMWFNVRISEGQKKWVIGCYLIPEESYTTLVGRLNDSRVRLRSEPNLNSETLGYLDKDFSLKVTDRTDDKFKIDGEEWYWYQVKTSDEKIGWVYGKYLDIE